jgi:hypothetical protein
VSPGKTPEEKAAQEVAKKLRVAEKAERKPEWPSDRCVGEILQ